MSLLKLVVRLFNRRWAMTNIEKYIALTHELCVLRIKMQGQPSEDEEALLAKIDTVWDSMSISEQDEVEEMEPYCDHPDGWLANDWIKRAGAAADQEGE